MKKKTRQFILLGSLLLILSISGLNSAQQSIMDSDTPSIEDGLPTPDIYNLHTSLAENISVPYLVSGPSGSATDPNFVLDSENNLHIVWCDEIDSNCDVLYRNYSYKEQKWGDIVNISSSSNDDEDPSICIDQDNNIWVVWAETASGPVYSLKGRFYNTQTGSWESVSTIVSPTVDIIRKPDIAAFSDGNATLVYEKIDGSWYNIFYINYDSSSENWGDTRQITYTYGDEDPDLYVDTSDNAHLVYVRKDSNGKAHSIMYTNFTWDGIEDDYLFAIDGSLNVTVNLNKNAIAMNEPAVVASASNNQIYVGWENKWYNVNDQIQFINMTLTDNINQNILNDTIINVTEDATNQHERATLSFGFGANNPVITWISEEDSGKVLIKKTITSSSEQYSDSSFTDISSTSRLDIQSDSNYSAYLVFRGEKDSSSKNQIWLQIYDIWHPQMQLINPSDDLLHAQDRDGNISFVVRTEPDTVSVKYEYWNDTNHNGVADGGDTDGVWGKIFWKNSTMKNFNYNWNTTNPIRRSYEDIIIKITAVDKHGLNTTKYITGMQIDNHGPSTVKLLSLTDTMGNYIENTAGDRAYFGKTIDFSFEVNDDFNQVDTVQLWNGTQLLATNTTSGNNVNITIDTETLGWNGNYTNLYLIANDTLGNSNTSVVFSREIVIDNTPPEINWVSLEEFMQYPQDDIDIKINTTLNDTASVAYYYYNVSAPENITFLGYASYDNGNWTLNWDIEHIDNQCIVKAQVIDKTGWETNDTIQISVDHTPPEVEILSPEQYETVGYRIWVLVQTEKDVVEVELYNSSVIDSGYVLANSSTNVVGETTTHKNFSIGFLTFGLQPNQWHYLKVRAFDSIRWGDLSQPRQIKISDKHPRIITIISGDWEEDETTDTFNVTISWNKPIFSENITRYLICRFVVDYTRNSIDTKIVDSINTMSDLQKIAYLGDQSGENFCVKNFNSSDGVVPLPEDVGASYEWTDTNVYAANYIYLVFAVNEVDLVSNCSEDLNIKITPQLPAGKSPDLRFVEMMPYLFIAYVVVLAFMGYIFVKSARRRRFQKETKDLLVEMDDEKFSEEGEKSLEDRLDTMEVMAEMSVKEDLGLKAPKIIESKADLDTDDAFLDMTIDEPKEDDIAELASGPRRCPHCNWMISSSATKCPRCGKLV